MQSAELDLGVNSPAVTDTPTPVRRRRRQPSDEPPPDGLATDTKARIRKALENISATTPGFQPRWSQRLMIAEVAKTLSGEYGAEHVACVEGPTGTGKSLAYLISAIPVAQVREKKLVVATATIALQEQLVHKDLPALRERSGLDFTYTLAKGRRRYLCDRDARRLAGVDENQDSLDFGDDADAGAAPWSVKPENGEPEIVRKMVAARESKQWSGDLDEWKDKLRDELIKEITTDAAGCTGKHCPHRAGCAFFAARKERQAMDVIVANHALVMADLMLGGGAVLPPPEDCIYILDEGHHVPAVAIAQGAAHARLVGPRTWLNDLTKLGAKAAVALSAHNEAAETADSIDRELKRDVPALLERLTDLHRALQSAHPALCELNNQDSGQGQGAKGHPGNAKGTKQRRKNSRYPEVSPDWRFPFGRVPDDLRGLFEQANAGARVVNAKVIRLTDQIKKGLEDQHGSGALSSALSRVQFIGARIDAMETAFAQLSAVESDDKRPPVARWITCLNAGADFECCASPVSGARLLRALLWKQCDGAIVTSATLTALGRFDRLFEQTGLGPRFGTRAIKLESPFDYANNAELTIPAVAADPKNHDAHTAEIIHRFNAGLIDPDEGTLVLFASYRQMRAVAEGLDLPLTALLSMQGDAPRHQILADHRARIEAGRGSIIFGVASMAEGVDLPGKQCSHVVIAKLPFSVPDSPVEATHAEWLEANGRNPFMELSVPEASFKLIQAAGRLLRTESDTGRVTVLDRRMADKPYGRQMMNALPPFRRNIEGRR